MTKEERKNDEPELHRRLYDALQAAVDRGTFKTGNVEGPNVLLRRGHIEFVVPVLYVPASVKAS